MKTKKMLIILSFLMIFSGYSLLMARPPAPVPTGTTPTLYGGECLDPGTMVIGATAGYPKTSFNLYWGIGKNFDFGLQTGFTYNAGLGGNRQWIGLDVHLPLRWTLFRKARVAGGLRVSPYFMIGDGRPSVSCGADVGFLIDIALPKIFKIIVGPEVRSGFATLGGTDIAGYDGGAWVNFGIETLLAKRFFLGVVLHGGALWGTGGLGLQGVFRTNLVFGARL